MTYSPPQVLFGAAYYNEYHREDRLTEDLDLMRQAHFTVIRVGESVWSTWEPESGQFDLDWLEPVLDGAHERGISVILGTPTYAVPPWLARLYPEIAGERSTGQRIGWGARQEVDFTHPAFLFHAERIIRKVVARYADHPAVIGFQVDNEPGNELFHNHGVFQRFVDYLRHRYGTVEQLNREWGLVYWSHRLSTWADLWTPDGNIQPQYDIAWRRFQAEQTTEFIRWQADIVREYAKAHHFVTTCIAYDRPALDDASLSRSLDVTAGNAYYAMQDGLLHPDDFIRPQYWTTQGTWALYQTADRMWSSRQAPFLVTETNAMHIGFPWNSKPAYDGQWRQAAWALVSRGASLVQYWHWHTLPFGAETYWGGVLPHSGQPGRTFAELSQLGAEFEKAGGLVSGLIPDSDIAMLYAPPNKWLMQKYPPLAKEDGSPDERSYQGLFDPFYQGAFNADLQIRIVHQSQVVGELAMEELSDPESFARQNPVLVVPGLYLADDATLAWLRSYATSGGHLVVGPRTGYADEEGRARQEVMPASLSDLAGVSYEEFSNLSAGMAVLPDVSGELRLSPGAAATRWVEALRPTDAQVLAHYDHPHFGRWAAVTTRDHGKGRVTCVGTVPNPVFARDFFRWLVPGTRSASQNLPDTVTTSAATGRDGQRLAFFHNWSWSSADVVLTLDSVDALGDEHYRAGEKITLGAWDVRVFVETR